MREKCSISGPEQSYITLKSFQFVPSNKLKGVLDTTLQIWYFITHLSDYISVQKISLRGTQDLNETTQWCNLLFQGRVKCASSLNICTSDLQSIW